MLTVEGADVQIERGGALARPREARGILRPLGNQFEPAKARCTVYALTASLRICAGDGSA
ncbi:MAG: hypothetical protein B7Z07_00615 [Sphingomonadales bacterium 32-67-7]|nr:MAG: hypothetical protein B7Z07_00615 [Sphingomonadales bacterium 32-67-7]